jgi:hypothetical protein
MNKIRWTRPTESGLCDRLYDIHFLSAYARVRDATLYTKWEKFDLKGIDVPHRKQDIQLENVLAHISLPSEIVIDTTTACEITFDKSIGAAANYQDLWLQHATAYCAWETFKTALDETAKGFTFCGEISAALARLPAKFVALHVRRGDKVRNEAHDGCFIETRELDRLNELTFKAIDHFLKSYSAFFVCGDEDEKIMPFVDYIRTRGGTLVEIPKLEKWRMTYYDLAVMTKSQFNITSQRRSTFSSFPALIGQGHYRTVYDLERDGIL